jgi:DNA uptake protein ComE-like DNA-binding protein
VADNSGSPSDIGWTPSQRRAILVLLGILLLYMTVRYVMNRQHISDPQPIEGSQASQLASRLDPNKADWQSLSTIPTLGEKRAREIVAYRERLRLLSPAAVVFWSPDDLLHVRGIGTATVANIQPYLAFPVHQSTRPSR